MAGKVLTGKGSTRYVRAPTAHHHPPEATTAEGKPFGTGRVNDVVRRLHKRSGLSIEYF
jgi:hypothetical protein